MPAPHNEKQRRTIVIFAVQLMDFLMACLSPRSLFQATQITKAVNSATVSILPARLQRVAAYQIEAGKLEASLGVADARARDVPKHIRLATARRTGTCASQEFEAEIRFLSVVPMNRQLVSDLLDVRRFQTHMSILAGCRS